MGRPRKWASDAERKAAKRSPNTQSKRTDNAVNGQDKRTQEDVPSKRTSVNWHPEVDQSIFDGKGRCVPVNEFILISLGAVPDGKPDCGVVSESDWQARLEQVCAHGLAGWACKKCLH